MLYFDRPLEPTRLSAAIEIAKQFKSYLPGGGPIQGGFSVAFGGPVMQMPMMSQPMPATGVILNRSAPDGSIENELRVELASITFRTTRYTRWSAIWEQAEKYYAAFINLYFDNGSQISNISINFADKYVWVGENQNFDPNLLLKRGSEYVAEHIFSLKDLWHIHTGAFLRSDDKTKRLININIDCLDETSGSDTRRAVLITTVLTDMFNQVGFEKTVTSSEDAMSVISAHMDSLHAFDKDILSKTLVGSMVKRIALIG